VHHCHRREIEELHAMIRELGEVIVNLEAELNRYRNKNPVRTTHQRR
jgi:hypothetical protein